MQCLFFIFLMSDIAKHVQNFASILTQTQTKALILWREKEFTRSWDWATYIEKIFVKLNEANYKKIICMIDEPQPILLRLELQDLKQSRLLLIRYILHSDYIDLNLGDVLARSIDSYKYFDNGKFLIQKIIDDRIKVTEEFHMANSFLTLTQDILSKRPTTTSYNNDAHHNRNTINSPNCIRLFDQKILTRGNNNKNNSNDLPNSTTKGIKKIGHNNPHVPTVINILSKNKYIDINDVNYVNCIGIFILKQYNLWKNNGVKSSEKNISFVDHDNIDGNNNDPTAESLLKSFTELFVFPLSTTQNSNIDKTKVTLPLCSADIASRLSDAYFPFARAYLVELVHAAIELSNGKCNTSYINSHSSITPILPSEIRPRFQHLMNHSNRLKLLCESMLQELIDNGIDDAVAMLNG